MGKKVNITYIVIRDEYNHKDTTANCANITSGGIGYSYAHFYLRSQFNRGYEFVIEIYGVVKGMIYTTPSPEELEEEEEDEEEFQK